MADIVTHTTKTESRKQSTAGNWKQRTNFRQVKRIVSRCEYRLKICKKNSYCTEDIPKAVIRSWIQQNVISGEIFAVDKDAKIAIVSADKDYRSVLDYWTPRLSVPNQLVRCKTLAKAISHVNGEGARKTLVNERMKILDLQTEYGRYEERKRIVNEITVLFAGTDYAVQL